jgi:two-component system, OmpR family, phosphate regulon sensor histidine kinase PhoR
VLIGLLIAIVVAVAVGVVHGRLRRRVRQLVRSVREMSEGVLDESIDVGGVDDVAALSSSLRVLRNQMSVQVELLERQRRMLQALVDQLQEGVIVARGDGRLALINPTAVRLLGLRSGRAADLVGESVETCIPQHALQNWLLGVTPLDADSAPMRRLEVESDAGPVHLLVRAAEVVLAEPGLRTVDAPRGRVVMLTDTTELNRSIQMRTDFVANASHELRTPLATIRAAIETLLTMDLVAEGAAARTFMEKIDRHSARLELMVGDLLDLSRLETPATSFEAELIDLRRTLDDLHARFAERIERKRLRWEVVRTPRESWAVSLNPHLLRLILDNLVDNATKFTEPGGRIRVGVQIQPEEVVFAVSDTGCGIPEEDQQRVFERFYQVQRARSGPERGTGLGLSIVRHAVGALRGTVKLESKLGEGTQITVVAPQVLE